MAVFKCKMCGGAIDITSGQSVVECAYCGTQQTIPKSTDENIQTMFNRANLLRQKNEFDKAEEMLKEAGAHYHLIGDGEKVGNLKDAITRAYEVVKNI